MSAWQALPGLERGRWGNGCKDPGGVAPTQARPAGLRGRRTGLFRLANTWGSRGAMAGDGDLPEARAAPLMVTVRLNGESRGIHHAEALASGAHMGWAPTGQEGHAASSSCSTVTGSRPAAASRGIVERYTALCEDPEARPRGGTPGYLTRRPLLKSRGGGSGSRETHEISRRCRLVPSAPHPYADPGQKWRCSRGMDPLLQQALEPTCPTATRPRTAPW